MTVHRHWAKLARVAVETLAVMIAGGLVARWLPPSPITDLIALVVLAAVVRFSWALVDWRRETITISDKRLFILNGILSRKLSMLPLRKVTDMALVQPLPGRILGYGGIIVESAGQNQALSEVHYIPNPLEFYRLLVDLQFERRGVPSQPPADAPRTDDTVAFEF